jgi:bifunctional DNA primase/polymerase-like protein
MCVLSLASRGFRLFPVGAQGKRPLVTQVLNTLMAQYRGCNWGLVTGRASAVFVLYVDGEGAAAICELERYCVEFRPALRPISVQF